MRVLVKSARHKYHASDDEIVELLTSELAISEAEARKYLDSVE